MERLKHIKYPPLKDKFKKYGDSFKLVSKKRKQPNVLLPKNHPGRDCIF